MTAFSMAVIMDVFTVAEEVKAVVNMAVVLMGPSQVVVLGAVLLVRVVVVLRVVLLVGLVLLVRVVVVLGVVLLVGLVLLVRVVVVLGVVVVVVVIVSL